MSKKKKDEQYTTKSMYEPVTGMVNDIIVARKGVMKFTQSAPCGTIRRDIDEFLKQLVQMESALSAPPRNCDVGTPEEQTQKSSAVDDCATNTGTNQSTVWSGRR